MYATTTTPELDPALENDLEFQRDMHQTWRAEANAQHEAMLMWARAYNDLVVELENKNDEGPGNYVKVERAIERGSVPLPVIQIKKRPFNRVIKSSLWVWKIARFVV